MASFFSSILRPPQSTPQPTPPQTSTSSSSTLNPLPELRIDDPMILWQSLYNDGYCVLPGAVSKQEVDNALRAINCSMGKHVPNRQDMCPDCPNTPAITDLFNKSSLKGVLNSLIGDYGTVGGGQIALRFPGDNTLENYQIPPNWQYHWHIDGLGDYKDKQKSALFGDINNFTALVGKGDPYDLHVIFHPLGVVLQDAEEDYMGNLTVYPGSHFQLQNYFRIYGFDELYQKGVEGLPQLDFNATRAVQIHARAGDAVILNYSTAHNIAPNISPYIRYTVYFRITCVHQRNAAYAFQPSPTSSMQGSIPLRHRPDAMLSVWSDWKGLQRMPFYSRDDTNGGIVALPRSETHTSVRPQRKESALPTMQNSQTPKSPEEDEEMRQLALAIERSKYEQ